LEVEAPARQDAKAQESAAANFELPQGSRTGWIDVQNVKLFLSEPEGSRRNKFTILGVEAPGWQGANTQEYLDIPSFRNAASWDASAYKM
jgi:hypothetical protein